MTFFPSILGRAYATDYEEAEKRCRNLYSAELAEIPDPGIVQKIGVMMKHSGIDTVVVNMRKLQPLDSKRSHLYRFDSIQNLWAIEDRPKM